MYPYSEQEKSFLTSCSLCPRDCHANRFTTKSGFCKCDAEFRVSSICCHKGEEPVISGKKGICNIFFSHCNMQCIYCQNYQISRNKGEIIEAGLTIENLIGKICEVLEETENIIGFVSPSHQIIQMQAIIRELHRIGKSPVVVYNSNGYDRVDTLKKLEGIVDVYLPDFKYSDSSIAREYSGTEDYPEIAMAALKEMYRQKGAALLTDDNGLAYSGIIIRHLVLPGCAEQSIKVLNDIAEEISPDLHISLMSQYFPTIEMENHPSLSRIIKESEFKSVVEAFHLAGFHRGWIQEIASHSEYRPDFRNIRPFSD